MRTIGCFLWTMGLCGCAGLPTSRLALPERNTLVRDQLAVHSDFALSTHHRLFEELAAQGADIGRRLALPRSDEPIHVYLFQNPGRFEGFMRLHHPEFPDRRAFFVATDSRLVVYAQWGDRMAEDLRHEVAHGHLHSVVPNVPLWLDEGVAEYYEVGYGQRGVNRPHVERLIERLERRDWRPDLARLEKWPTTYGMNQDDYAEAWAWVHFLMETRPERLEILRAYLSDLRREGAAAPISGRLASMEIAPEASLIDHIRGLGGE